MIAENYRSLFNNDAISLQLEKIKQVSTKIILLAGIYKIVN